MSLRVWLAGSLANHRRGRILRDLLGARPLEGEPGPDGVSLLFGLDFQDASPDDQGRWLSLPADPGRTLLLIPPLKLGTWARPSSWSVAELSEHGKAAPGSLPGLVAPEVRHRLAGVLQIPPQPDARWEDGAIHTGFHRKHPHAGIFAATCLPLWSAALLGHRGELATWLAQLHDLSGSPSPGVTDPEPGPGLLPEHYAVLLHLSTGHFADRAEALGRLSVSPVFDVEAGRARECYDELERHGLASDARPTEAGLSLLRAGPYSAYLEAMEEGT